ncbi:MAG: YihY/virulence factor BrkB family protein [Actinomycetota bacterium]|nr:YihY/virulence factor BrkB family protein [Actinomycetota bacterium]
MKLFRRERRAANSDVRDGSARPREDERPDSQEEVEGTQPVPTPQPEPEQPRLEDPGVTDLSKRDYMAVVVRAGKEAIADNIPDAAASVAYYSFLAIPAALLLSVGIFSLAADPEAIETLIDKLGTVVPAEATSLLEDSLHRVIENQRSGVIMIAVGVAVALWTATSAANAVIRALNVAYDRTETRPFWRQRLVSLALLALLLVAFLLVFGLLVLGPALSDWVGGLVDATEVFQWLWWTAQWPILVLALLLVFAAILLLAPNVEHPRWQFVTLGSVVATVLWLVVSGLFAVYVSMFGSYNKTWGSLAAVIVMLTWLWLSALALLFGAEINAEAERSREMRQGTPPEETLNAPLKAPPKA